MLPESVVELFGVGGHTIHIMLGEVGDSGGQGKMVQMGLIHQQESGGKDSADLYGMVSVK